MAPIQNIPADPNAVDPTAVDPTQAAPMEGAAPEATPGMASPEQMAQIKELMNNIEEKYRQMNAEVFAGGNQTESQKKELVIEVFKALQGAGVDLTDVNSVKQFLDQLQQENPDLYDIFVSAFEGLLGGEAGAALPPEGAVAPEESAVPPAPEGVMPPMPGSFPGGVPSNDGLSGMVPPAGGMAGKFPNLAK